MSCPVRLPFRDGAPEFLYEPSALLLGLQAALPRFGFPDSVTEDWMAMPPADDNDNSSSSSSSSSGDKAGYAMGVMGTGIIVTCLLVVWAVLLVGCARAGAKRVGWWSGKQCYPDPPSAPPSSSLYTGKNNDDDHDDHYDDDYDDFNVHVNDDPPQDDSAVRTLPSSSAETEKVVMDTSTQSSLLTAKRANVHHVPDPMSDVSVSDYQGEDDITQSIIVMDETNDLTILDQSYDDEHNSNGSGSGNDRSGAVNSSSDDSPSMFYDDDDKDDDEEEEEDGSDVKLDDDSTILPPPQDANNTTTTTTSKDVSYLPAQPETPAPAQQLEISALTTPDTLLVLSSTQSVGGSSTTSSHKYAEYMKYLDEAGSSRKLITTGNNKDQYSSAMNNLSRNTSMDSDDCLLDEILADEEPVAWTSSPPPRTNKVVVDNRYMAAGASPTLLRAIPDTSSCTHPLDVSFPDQGPEGFLFEDSDSASASQNYYHHPDNNNDHNNDHNDREDKPTPITTSTTATATRKHDDSELIDSPASLPKSQFTSKAASRKRLLETYVRDYIHAGYARRTTNIHHLEIDDDLLVTDDSTLLLENEYGIVIRPEPVAKVIPFPPPPPSPSSTSTFSSSSSSNNSSSSMHPTSNRSTTLSDTAAYNAQGDDALPKVNDRQHQQHALPSDKTTTTTKNDKEEDMDLLVVEIRPTSTPPTDHSTSTLDAHEQDEDEYQYEYQHHSKDIIMMDDYQRAHAVWLQQRRQAGRRLNRLRGAIVIACTLLVIGTLLGALNGAWALDWQRQSITNAWTELESTALQLQGFLQELQIAQSSIRQQLWNLWQMLDQHCPLVRGSVCPLAYLPSNYSTDDVSCNLTGIPLQSSWQNLLDVFVDPQTIDQTLFDPEDWNAVAMDVDAFAEQPVEIALDGWNWALWAAVACNSLLSFFALAILAAISFPEARRLHFQLSTWSFAAVYWVTVALAWIFGLCFLIGTILTVDTCTSTVEDALSAPPATVAKTLLDRINTRSFLPAYWDYIVDGCPSESYPEYVNDRVWAWANFLPTTFGIANELEALSDNAFLETCGSPISDLRNAASTLSLQMCMVTQSLVNIRRNLGCDQWYPWYASMANESICRQGSTAFVWSSASQILILVMAFLIWTLRVSFLSLAPTTRQH